MGDHLWAGKPSQYVTGHPGQLSLFNHFQDKNTEWQQQQLSQLFFR